MKRILVLLAITSLITIANAAVTEFTLSTDGTVLYVDGTADASIDGNYIVSNDGSVIDIAVPQGSGFPTLHTTLGNGGNNDFTAGDLAAVNIASIGSPFGDIAQIFALTSPATGDSIDAGRWFTIDIDDMDTSGFTFGQVIGQVEILDNQASSLGSIDLTYIPEPITITLLGIGSFFLRRRK